MSAVANWASMISFIWSVKEILRDHYKRHEYGEVILPLVVLRRLDSTLAEASKQNSSISIKDAVLKRALGFDPPYDAHYDLLCRVADLEFYNTSKFDFASLLGDEHAIVENFNDYLNGYSPNVREIIQAFDFWNHVERLGRAGILFQVIGTFADPRVDLSPSNVSNLEMGYVYEELVRTVADLSNEEAGEHFTPREVIELMVALLVADDPDLHKPGRIVTVYDPACGTGGMLTEAKQKLVSINSSLKVHLRGQEVQPESFAICTSDMLIKGERTAEIRAGDTLGNDRFAHDRFNYVIANPPYGKDWKTVEKKVKAEHAQLGMAGRFGPGLPPTTDGQMLFLLHMLSKLKPADQGGGRLAVVMNGSPLFTGDAGSGPSEIRRYLIENDLLEAIVGLPTELFYNTGIATYVWLVTNRKSPERSGYIQFIDARDLYEKMPKSLGNKRHLIGPQHQGEILHLYESLAEGPRCHVLKNENLGYRQISILRPSQPRDIENLPLGADVADYFRREVLPFAPDAGLDKGKTKIGYEIPFTRLFYSRKLPRPLSEIDRELRANESRVMELLEEESRAQGATAGRITTGGPRRPTSIPWLPDLPAGWREVKLSLVAELGSGHTPSRQHPEWWADPTIPWITTGEVTQMRGDRIEFITETRELISETGLANSSATLRPTGTVVLSRTASAGFSAIMGTEMATSQDFVTWTCGPMLRPRFLLLCLRAMRADLLGRLAMGSTHKTIYMPEIQSIRIPLPPLEEQDRIVEAVSEIQMGIDHLADAFDRQSQLLAERRAALLFAAAAGQLDGA